MDFFKSVFADEEEEEHPEPNQSSSPSSNPQSPSLESEDQDQPTTPTWGFVGGLIKTFATKSESVIETYRRDLQEFSTGLKKETQVLKVVASSSLEVGASKAQESLESVGQAFDSIGSVVWKSTAQIITQVGQDGSDLETEAGGSSLNVNANSPVGKYSRFEAQLRGIQTDASTFVEEPEDVEDYVKWKTGFNLNEKEEEIEGLRRGNVKLDAIYKRVVPNLVNHEVFWCRYYFRVYKLEQAESVRAKLVERAKEDEDLSWDVDDDDDEDQDEGNNGNVVEEKVVNESLSNNKDNEEVKKDETMEMKKDDVDEKAVVVEEKAASEVSKDSDISVVSSQPSSRGEEEDLGWDEIEDLGSDDEDGKKGKQSEGTSSPSNREELRKRLSVAEDDEDLSWDIEDDDEPIKKS